MSAFELFGRTAVTIRVAGRYALASRYDLQGNRREFACRTSHMSPFQVLIAAPVLAPIGERVISYFAEFGKLEGWITDLVEGALLIEIAANKEARIKLASKLAWLEKQQRNTSIADIRRQKRLIPKNPYSTLIFTDGSMMSCFVIDMSPAGVAVSADVELRIGMRVAVGCCIGHVVRRFNEGFAVKFDTMQDIHLLERMVRPPADFTVNPFAAERPAPIATGCQPAGNSPDVLLPGAGKKKPAGDRTVWYI